MLNSNILEFVGTLDFYGSPPTTLASGDPIITSSPKRMFGVDVKASLAALKLLMRILLVSGIYFPAFLLIVDTPFHCILLGQVIQ